MRRSPYWALAGLALLTLVLLKLPRQTSSNLKVALSGVFLPLFGVASSAERLTENSSVSLASRAELEKQLEETRREKEQLQLRVTELEELARENGRLRQQVGLPPHLPWRLTFARVVARDPANWWRTIKIDRGLRDGVMTNCPVFTVEGLVGRVSVVELTHSQVVLLGDPGCRISAMIEETRDTGVIAPSSSSPLDNILVDLSHLSRSMMPRPGQRVVTSGMGGIFPKGLLIGHIVDARSVGFGLYNEARVKVAVRLNALEEVWVKLP